MKHKTLGLFLLEMFSIDLSNFWSQSGREYKRAIDQRGTKPSNRLRRRKGLLVNEDGK